MPTVSNYLGTLRSRLSSQPAQFFAGRLQSMHEQVIVEDNLAWGVFMDWDWDSPGGFALGCLLLIVGLPAGIFAFWGIMALMCYYPISIIFMAPFLLIGLIAVFLSQG